MQPALVESSVSAKAQSSRLGCCRSGPAASAELLWKLDDTRLDNEKSKPRTGSGLTIDVERPTAEELAPVVQQITDSLLAATSAAQEDVELDR